MFSSVHSIFSQFFLDPKQTKNNQQKVLFSAILLFSGIGITLYYITHLKIWLYFAKRSERQGAPVLICIKIQLINYNFIKTINIYIYIYNIQVMCNANMMQM